MLLFCVLRVSLSCRVLTVVAVRDCVLSAVGAPGHFIPQADYVANAVDDTYMEQLWGSEHSSGEALDIIGALQYSDDADAKSCNVVARFEHLAPDLDAVSTWSGVNVRTKWQKPSTEKCTLPSGTQSRDPSLRFGARKLRRSGTYRAYVVR